MELVEIWAAKIFFGKDFSAIFHALGHVNYSAWVTRPKLHTLGLLRYKVLFDAAIDLNFVSDFAKGRPFVSSNVLETVSETSPILHGPYHCSIMGYNKIFVVLLGWHRRTSRMHSFLIMVDHGFLPLLFTSMTAGGNYILFRAIIELYTVCRVRSSLPCESLVEIVYNDIGRFWRIVTSQVLCLVALILIVVLARKHNSITTTRNDFWNLYWLVTRNTYTVPYAVMVSAHRRFRLELHRGRIWFSNDGWFKRLQTFTFKAFWRELRKRRFFDAACLRLDLEAVPFDVAKFVLFFRLSVRLARIAVLCYLTICSRLHFALNSTLDGAVLNVRLKLGSSVDCFLICL